VTLLECINGPEDLKELSQDQLTRLAGEIRDLLIETTTRTGGHLGPNLGVVELTIAIHRVFDSPKDRIVFDTGHQSYVHKLLTGRVAQFGTLKQYGGLTGYPCQAESEHDLVENSHASTSLSYGDGLAKAYKLRGEPDRTVVAVIVDRPLRQYEIRLFGFEQPAKVVAVSRVYTGFAVDLIRETRLRFQDLARLPSFGDACRAALRCGSIRAALLTAIEVKQSDFVVLQVGESSNRAAAAVFRIPGMASSDNHLQLVLRHAPKSPAQKKPRRIAENAAPRQEIHRLSAQRPFRSTYAP